MFFQYSENLYAILEISPLCKGVVPDGGKDGSARSGQSTGQRL